MRSEPRPVPPNPEAAAPRLRFATFEVDLRARELLRNGERVPLQDRPFEVLAALLERPGEVVLRQELQDRLWPGQIVEFDNNLNTALTKLRRALDDTTDSPTVIETLPKRGYRLLVPVERILDSAPAAEVSIPSESSIGRWAAWALVLAAVAAALFIASGRVGGRSAPEVGTDAGSLAAGGPTRTSLLVVLPFVALGDTTSDKHLADTLTEELINRLAELLPPELGVIARTSAMTFRDTEADVATIRDILGVDYVLEGSVGRDGSVLQIRTRFIHTADQAHLWAESYDATIDEMPRIQRSVAERIATAVSSQLRSSGAIKAGESAAPEAWEAYLQARFLLTSSLSPSEEQATVAVLRLEQAVEIAPDFALAWAALADAVYRQSGPAPARHDRARQAAERALEIDPSLALPHHRLANLALYQNWDWEEAGREFDWALSLAPNLAVNHHSRAAWYSSQGRHEEALESIERALHLDPLSVVLHADAGWYLFVARRYDEAVERCRQAIEIVPTHRGANSYLLHSLLALGETEQAAAVARTLLEIEAATPEVRQRAEQLSEAAIDELHRHRLTVLEAGNASGTASPGRLALAHLALGHTEEALTALESGLEQRWGWIYPFLAVYPLLDPLVEEPRFRRMVEQVGSS